MQLCEIYTKNVFKTQLDQLECHIIRKVINSKCLNKIKQQQKSNE